MKDTTAKQRFLRGTILGTPVFLWAFVAMVGVALAVTAFIWRIEMTGTVSTAQGFELNLQAAGEVSETNSTVGTCNIEAITGNHFEVTATGMLPNEYCYFEIGVTNIGPADAVFQSFNLVPDGTNGITVTAQNTIHGDKCGTLIPATEGRQIAFQIDFGPDLVPGFSYAMTDPVNDTLEFVRPEMYNPGDCP